MQLYAYTIIRIQHLMFLFFCASQFFCTGVTIQTPPLYSEKIYTPYALRLQYKPVFIDHRTRYSTCTGAAWFHDNYIAVLNLCGGYIATYQFDATIRQCKFLQMITNTPRIPLIAPENLDISSDGTLLAVGTGVSFFHIFSINPLTHRINPTPIWTQKLPGLEIIHAVRFNHNATSFGYVSFNNDHAIGLYKIIRDFENMEQPEHFTLQQTAEYKNPYDDIKPKSLCFTRNNKFVLIVYSYQQIHDEITIERPLHTIIEVYQFNPQTGQLGNTVCTRTYTANLVSVEDLVLINNDSTLIATNQGEDQLLLFDFDPVTGIISDTCTIIEGPAAQLSFPHGLGISPDGNYLAVSNYGTDSFEIYAVH